MKHLEQMIIGSAIGEGQYSKIEFLEAEDFVYYREYWRLAKHHKGDLIKMVQNYPDDARDNIVNICNLAGSTDIYMNAVLLTELRFKRLLDTLLYNLSKTTLNALESNLLIEAKELIPSEDIFDLSDILIKYIGHQITPPTKKRIEDFLKYRDGRVKIIKSYQPKR